MQTSEPFPGTNIPARNHTLAGFPEVVGSFEGELLHTTPANFPPLTMRLALFADGNVIGTHQLYQSPTPFGGAALASPPMGMWARTGPRTGQLIFSMDIWAAGGPRDGAALAKERVTWNFCWDPRTGSLSGAWTAELFDPSTGKLTLETAGSLRVAPANRPATTAPLS